MKTFNVCFRLECDNLDEEGLAAAVKCIIEEEFGVRSLGVYVQNHKPDGHLDKRIGEVSGYRDSFFNTWVSKKLPHDSFIAMDIDMFLANSHAQRAMMLEVKLQNAEIKPWQKKWMEKIEAWIRAGTGRWIFEGFKPLIFEKTTFKDGRVFFDGKEVTEEELIRILRLEP